MILYWLMLAAPLIGATFKHSVRLGRRSFGWILVATAFVFLIGLRHEVGGDWFNYERQFYFIAERTFQFAVFESKDPGYYASGWILSRVGLEIYSLNLMCAMVLVTGVFLFARQQPMPWVSIAASVPYLLIVVGMGYTRQAAAIGLVLHALVFLQKQRLVWYVLFVLIAAAFHKSALVMLPIAALAAARNRIISAAWVMIMLAVGAWLFVFESADALWQSYVVSDYAFASEGGVIRVWMNAVPALLLLIFRNRIGLSADERRLWTWMAALALLCIPLLEVSVTATDRLALYFIPVQLFMFPRLVLLLKGSFEKTFAFLAIFSYFALVQFIWLNYAAHSRHWLPYMNVLWS